MKLCCNWVLSLSQEKNNIGNSFKLEQTFRGNSPFEDGLITTDMNNLHLITGVAKGEGHKGSMPPIDRQVKK